MKIIFAFLTAVFCLLIGTANAQVGTLPIRSIDTMQQICLSPTPTQKTFCAGYLMGVAEMLLIVGQHGGINAGIRGVCNNRDQGTRSLDFALDESARALSMLIAVYTSWAKNNPKLGTNDRLSGAMLALQRAWPCRKKTPPKK